MSFKPDALFQPFGAKINPTSVIKLKYLKTKTVSQVDDYHGTKVSDPYRWLEDDKAPEVEKWVRRKTYYH